MKEQNVNSVGEISRRDLFKAAALGAGAYMLGAQLGSSPAHAAVKEDKWWRAGENWVNTSQYKKKPPYRIAAFCSYLEGTWMSMYTKHIEYEARVRQKDLVKELMILNASAKIPKQIEDIKDIVTKGVDGIIVDALSPTALIPVCREVMKKGIPVVISKNTLDSDDFVQLANDDGVGFGIHGGNWLVKQLNGKGKIICLRGIPGYGVDIERFEGATRVFKEYPDIEIVGAEYGYWTVEKGKEVSKALLAANPKIDGAWTAGGQMARGLVMSLMEAKRDMIPIASEDENGFCKLWKQYHSQGLEAIATAKPVWQGGYAVQSLLWTLQGCSVPHRTIFPAAAFEYKDLDKYLRPDLPDDVWLTNTLPEDILKEMFKGR
jgi:ribose transport system substrate-binding protein